MPMFDLTLPAGALEPSALAELVEGITTALLHWEGAPDNPASRALAWGFVHELPEGAINVGGEPVELPFYRVFLTVPHGTPGIHGPLNEPRRNKLVRQVTELVLAAEGCSDVDKHGSRVWCMIREQPDGFWGASGRIFRMTDIAAIVMADEPVASAASPS